MAKGKHNTVSLKHLGRSFAVQILFQIEVNKDDEMSVTSELEKFWQQATDSDVFKESKRIHLKGKAFAERLSNGVLDNIDEIDELLKKYSQKWDVSRMAIVDKNIMRIAIFEMLHCIDIPPIVSINEGIELSKEYSDDKSKVFINGILNNIKNTLSRSARGENK